MKLLLHFCILIAISLTLLSVSAQDSSHDCPHSGATITDLQSCVTHAAEMGHIGSDGILQALLVKLDSAQRAFNQGQVDVAVNNLNAFINLVEAQSGKHIDAQEASHMIHHAQQVVDAII